MTCIVGVRDGDQVLMGCDSAFTYGWKQRAVNPTYPKLFRLGDVLIGGAGSLRAHQIISGVLVPAHEKTITDLAYLFDVVDLLRQRLKEYGCTTVENNAEEADSLLLMGYHGQLYLMAEDFALLPVKQDFEAIGTGGDVALGVLAALHDTDLTPHVKLMRALDLAAQYAMGVIPPFYFSEDL